MVGIRYLHPRIVPSGSQPASHHLGHDNFLLSDAPVCQTYRRFQITFKDAQDASRCIDAIKSVCPCKANPYPTHLNRQSTALSGSLMRTATTMPGPVPGPVRPARPTEHQSIALVPPGPSTVLSHPPADNQPFSIALSSVATSLSSDDSAFVTCSETSYRTDTQVDHRRNGPPQSRGRDAPQSSLPNSSQPSSSDQSMNMPPPPVPRRVAHESADATTQEPSRTVNTGDGKSQLLASLGRHPSLYELSRTDLETLVSQVIREEGFLHLVT